MANPQKQIDTATAAIASQIATPDASAAYRASVKGGIKLPFQLSPSDRSLLDQLLPFPVIYEGGPPMTHDHPVVAGLRAIVRQVHSRVFGDCRQKKVRTLCVGATRREIRQYIKNPFVHYHVPACENKDEVRIVGDLMSEISESLRQKASKKDRRVFRMKGAAQDYRRPVKVYGTLDEVYDDFIVLNDRPQCIHTSIVPAQCLVFEDSVYNLGAAGILDAFETSGATFGHGYAFLPMELLFPNMAPNPLYKFRDLTGPSKGMSAMTWVHGHSNGYAHRKKDWACILEHSVVSNSRLAVGIEIVCRIGPMCVFSMYRCRNKETVARSIELTPFEQYVRMLDIDKSVDRATGRPKLRLEHFSVPLSAYTEVIEYLLSLDPKSLTLPNCVAFIRRRKGGTSLINKELTKPWHLQANVVFKFAQVCVLKAKLMVGEWERLKANVDSDDGWEKFGAFFRAVASVAFFPLTQLLRWIMRGRLADQLVLGAPVEAFQTAIVDPNGLGHPVGTLYLDHENEEESHDCPLCTMCDGIMGLQKLRCKPGKRHEHTFVMTREMIDRFRDDNLQTDNVHPNLAAVMKAAREACPTEPFEITVKVNVIDGGPGTGKSEFIRRLGDESDLVIGPFAKLKSGYEGVEAKDGHKYDMKYKTTHRATTTVGHRRVFLDEWTSFPYETLCIVLHNNNAEELFLVGDEKQCKLRDGMEGMYIGKNMPIGEFPTHQLVRNFRNPRDTVALLNKTYGYKMEPMSEVETSIEWVDSVPEGFSGAQMAFSQNAARVWIEDKTATVRSNQGSTHKSAVLFVTTHDHAVSSMQEMQIVGLSRHKEHLYIVSDGSDVAARFKANTGWTEDFHTHITEHLQYVEDDIAVQPFPDDPALKLVLPKVHPPMDSHLLLDYMQQSAVVASEEPFNAISSSLVDESGFGKQSDATLSEDFLAPVNARGHPMSMTRKAFSICGGSGLHFSAESACQELQVMGARYMNHKVSPKLSEKGMKFARDAVDAWFERNMDIRPEALELTELGALQRDFFRSAKSKSYHRKFRGIDNPDVSTVRFFLKSIFKPQVGVLNSDKPGQGISCWDADLSAYFCMAFRILGEYSRKCERAHVMTDNGMSEEAFINLVTTQFAMIDNEALHAVSDGTMFDSQQNEFTQYVERYYWEKLGINPDFLEHYYRFRREYRMQGKVVRGKCTFEKSSGEPGTKENNGLVAKVLSDYVIVGDGPYTITYKGDDFDKYQCNAKVDEERLAMLHTFTPLRLVIKIGMGTEFCGLSVAQEGIAPSMYRKVIKFAAHRFRSYKHFCEYQCSLRTTMELVTKLGHNSVAMCDVLAHPTLIDLEDAMQAIYILEAVCHWDERQFKDAMGEAKIIPLWVPRADDNDLGVKFTLD